MIITTTTKVTFDPVKEYKAMMLFERNNPDCVKVESTVGVTFVKVDVASCEVEV